MRTERISSTSFGLRPELRVSKENTAFFNTVADAFDRYNKKLRHDFDDVRIYEIVQNKRGLIFTEYKDGWEHRIRFGKKLTQELLEKPADLIAKALAKAAEIFALDDKLWFKTAKFAKGMYENRQLGMSVRRQGEYEDSMLEDVYNKYILQTLKEKLKENGLLTRAKIEL